MVVRLVISRFSSIFTYDSSFFVLILLSLNLFLYSPIILSFRYVFVSSVSFFASIFHLNVAFPYIDYWGGDGVVVLPSDNFVVASLALRPLFYISSCRLVGFLLALIGSSLMWLHPFVSTLTSDNFL